MRRISGLAALALALPLAACSTATAGEGTDLVRAGCPTEVRIQTDALPHVEWGFLYRLLDADAVRVRGDEVSGPLVLDGARTGVTLTILTGDPRDGVSANTQLHEDADLLLGAVDTDVALLDATRAPTVGVFAPLARDPRLLYWDAEVYPDLRDIERFSATSTPDGASLMPVAAVPGDPFIQYAIGTNWISRDQIVAGTDVDVELTVPAFVAAGGIRAQTGDALTEPHRLQQDDVPRAARWQVIDDIGYTRDAGVLSAAPQTLVRHADCLRVLVPEFQRSLVAFVDDPEPTVAMLVDLAAELGDESYDIAAASAALEQLIERRYIANARDGSIGAIDIGRVRSLVDRAVPRWRDAEVDVPVGITADDIATNEFVDRSIGL